jgi:hypothetical protein
MRWLSHSLWLLAWSYWVWLGFGLYRELPRDLGPVVCELPLRPDEWVVGVLPDRPSIVTAEQHANGITHTVRRRHAPTGAVEAVMNYDGLGIQGDYTLNYCFTRPKSIHVRCEWSPGDRAAWKVYILDLESGTWRSESDLGQDPMTVPGKPWVLFRRHVYPHTDATFMLYDLETGRRLFDSRNFPPEERHFAPTDMPIIFGDDQFAVPVVDRRSPDRRSVEICAFPTGTLVRRLEGVRVEGWPTLSSKTGRAACYASSRAYETEVIDFETGHPLRTIPAVADRVTSSMAGPYFSADGAKVLSVPAAGLFAINSGERIWAARPHEVVLDTVDRDTFVVEENWSFAAWDWGWWFQTYAARSLADGTFRYRCWSPPSGDLALAAESQTRGSPSRNSLIRVRNLGSKRLLKRTAERRLPGEADAVLCSRPIGDRHAGREFRSRETAACQGTPARPTHALETSRA